MRRRSHGTGGIQASKPAVHREAVHRRSRGERPQYLAGDGFRTDGLLLLYPRRDLPRHSGAVLPKLLAEVSFPVPKLNTLDPALSF